MVPQEYSSNVVNIGRMIDELRFWHVIETCRFAARQDIFRFLVAWESQLRGMSLNDTTLTLSSLQEICGRLVSWDTFAVAWIVTGGSREDFYPRILELVVAHGRVESDLFSRHADHYAGMKRMVGRWSDCNLSSTGRRVVTTRPDRSTQGTHASGAVDQWNIIFRKLGVTFPEGSNASELCETLKAHCPHPPETWEVRFPAAVALARAHAIGPAYDRRTPMTQEKVWQVIDECRALAQPWQFLPGLLATHPKEQATDFAVIVSALVDDVHLRLSHLPDYAPWMGWWVTGQGQEVFEAVAQGASDPRALLVHAQEGQTREFQNCVQSIVHVPSWLRGSASETLP